MTDPRALAAGTTVTNRYTIEEALGALGAGPVYRALDGHLQRRVTLRAYAPAAWDPADRKRFEADIRKATPLDHANLAGIRDVGTDPELGLGFLVYEPHNGMTLSRFLARGEESPVTTAVQIMHDVAEGVGASHWAGLVHGEIHPGTVFLASSEGDRRLRVQLLTPGLPAAAGAGTEGTPAARYAAPEVLRDGQRPTPASDVYSLGVVAYELLVGLPARWDASVVGTVRREDVTIPPAHEIRPEVPPDVANAIAGALHIDPAQRYKDASVFAIVLAHALDEAAMGPRMSTAFEGMPDFLRDADDADDAGSPDAPATPAVAAPAAPAAAAGRVAGADPVADPDAAPAAGGATPRRRAPILAAAVVALLAAGGALWAVGSRGEVTEAGASPASAQVASLDAGATDGMDGAPVASGDSTPAAASEAGPQTDPAAPEGATARGDSGRQAPARTEAAAERDRGRVEEEAEIDVPPAPLAVGPVAPIQVAVPDADRAAAEAAMPFQALPTPAPASSSTGPGDVPRAQRVYGLAQVDEAPTLKNMIRLQRGLRAAATTGMSVADGKVLLEFVVLPTGRVDTSTVEVLDASSRLLYDASREVMALADFEPGTLDGSPVRVRVQMELVLSARED